MAISVVLAPDRVPSEPPKPLFTIAATTGSNVTFGNDYLPADDGRKVFFADRSTIRGNTT